MLQLRQLILLRLSPPLPRSYYTHHITPPALTSLEQHWRLAAIGLEDITHYLPSLAPRLQ